MFSDDLFNMRKQFYEESKRWRKEKTKVSTSSFDSIREDSQLPKRQVPKTSDK